MAPTRWRLDRIIMDASGLDRREARRQLRYLGWRHYWRYSRPGIAILIAWVVGGGLLGFAFLTATEHLSQKWDTVVGLMFLMIVAVPWMLAMRQLARMESRRITHYLRRPLCFKCGYDLRGIPPQRQPSVIPCPECGNPSPCFRPEPAGAAQA